MTWEGYVVTGTDENGDVQAKVRARSAQGAAKVAFEIRKQGFRTIVRPALPRDVQLDVARKLAKEAPC